MNMQGLIQKISAFVETARANGDIPDTDSPGAPRVWMGYQSKAGQGIPLTAYPYVLLDDGGERTEVLNGNTQRKIYRVEVELMNRYTLVEDSLLGILDFSDKVRLVFEQLPNRQFDGMIFGVQVTPILDEGEQGYIYRGRRIAVDYYGTPEDIFEQF